MARILLADDDAHIVRVMSIWLERHGYDLVTASNGAEALEVLDRGGIDLIVSDMNMPVMDGVAMARAIRDRGEVDVPILLLTARCDQQKLAGQMEEYRVLVYPKPFVPSKLVAEVNRLLGPVPTTP